MRRMLPILFLSLLVPAGCGDDAVTPAPTHADADSWTFKVPDSGPLLPHHPDHRAPNDTFALADTATDAFLEEDPCLDPEPGGFCAPCEVDADCESGFCVWSPAGKVCTVACVEECPLDWTCEVVGGTWPDVIHICMPRFMFLCDPCAADEDCNVSGVTNANRCLSLGPAGSFCAEPCKPGTLPCPDGYVCEPPPDGSEGDSHYCVPEADCACSDTARQAALATACYAENEHGACPGMRECAPEGLTSCDAPMPAAETCDGADNDCDGQTDEDLGTITCGEGACAVAIPACTSGEPAQCDTAPADTEVCNGLDDDCDGETDEDLEPVTCGQGKCEHEVQSCINGQPQPCNPFQGAAPESCNGIDDDCDGQVDEDLGTQSCGQGTCAHTVQACVNGMGQTCNPFEGATPEECNGLDDNCDGQVDNNLGVTSCGQGKCAHSVPDCVNGQPQLCDPFQGAGPEFCNGQDDDCDGQVDEQLGTITCGGGACQQVIPACVNGIPQQCGNIGLPQPEMCDGQDNDCDGQVDEAGALGCQNYYADKDGDGWGASNDYKCLCQPDAVYKKNQGGDCYDQSVAVYPGNQGWYTEHRGDGLFDYNCDGQETLQFNDMFYCAPGCNFSTPGWYGFKPLCGQKGVFATVCVYFMICDIYNNQMVAACQ